MSLIIILLALLAERMAVFIHPWREHHWFEQYSQKITLMVKRNAYFALPFSIIPVVAVIFLAHWVLAQVSFGWASWIFDLIVLIYCLGNTHLRVQIRECYEQIELGNLESARALLFEYFDVLETGDITPDLLMKAFYRASLQRVFAVLFWFVVCGPVGAVLYRMIHKLSVYHCDNVMEKMQHFAEKIAFVLDWIPARLLALSFCLAGHFTDIFTVWQTSFKTEVKATYQILYACGHVAVRAEESPDTTMVLAQFEEAYYLVCRSLFIWLVVLALIILF